MGCIRGATLCLGLALTRYKVKNWERFQHFKDRLPPWIKLYRDILDDYDINMISSDAFKFLIQLWLLASQDKEGKGYLPPVHQIAYRLRLSKNKCLDLLRQVDTFLISEQYQNDDEETETYKEETYKEETEKNNAGRKKPARLSEKDWLVSLRENEAYSHIDLEVELARMDAWLSTRPRRKKTRKFIVNWLNRIDPPVGPGQKRTAPEGMQGLADMMEEQNATRDVSPGDGDLASSLPEVKT